MTTLTLSIMNRPFVIAFYKPNSGVSYHRTFAPLICHKDADVFFIEKITDIEPEHWAKATHIFASRAFPVEPFEDFVKLCRKDGVKMIVDQDDWWVLPPSHPLKGVYSEAMRERIVRSMKAADEVWVTNKHLASKVRKHNANIRIIPNAISVPTWQIEREPSEQIRFGYIGGNHHQVDIKRTGIDLSSVESYVADVDGYPEMMKAKYKMATLPPNQYHRLYNKFDVSLVPLATSEFAKCKSHLKMIEAGFSKCALIISQTEPYAQYITKDNCIAIKSNYEWAGAIKRLNENPNQVADIAESLYHSMKKFTMDNMNELRIFE
jgi:glycosyltransferase involved in cell wall biosynthesis